LLKHPECEKYIEYSEKFHDKLCVQGKRKFPKNPERLKPSHRVDFALSSLSQTVVVSACRAITFMSAL